MELDLLARRRGRPRKSVMGVDPSEVLEDGWAGERSCSSGACGMECVPSRRCYNTLRYEWRGKACCSGSPTETF